MFINVINEITIIINMIRWILKSYYDHITIESIYIITLHE